MKALKSLFLVTLFIVGMLSCKSEGNIPAGVNILPENETYDIDAAPGHLVIIDFNAEWCGPCKRFEPIFKKAAEKYKGKVEFVSIDVDKHQQLAQKLQIMSIPALLFINADGTKDWHIGFMEEADFDKTIAQYLDK